MLGVSFGVISGAILSSIATFGERLRTCGSLYGFNELSTDIPSQGGNYSRRADARRIIMEKRIVVLGAAKLVNGQWQEVANFKKMGKFYAAAQLQERMVEPTEESIFEKIAAMPAAKSPFTMKGTTIGVVANEGMLKTQKKLVMYSVLYNAIEVNKTTITEADIAGFDNMFADDSEEGTEGIENGL